MARDMEYHFDVHEKLREIGVVPDIRPMLLYVSREGLTADGCDGYLHAQLANVSAAVLLDTGFHGTVVRAIAQKLPQTDLRSHMLCSFAPDIPGSEYGLSMLAARIPASQPARRKLVKDAVEHIPHRYSKVTVYDDCEPGAAPRLTLAGARWSAAADRFKDQLLAALIAPEMLAWIKGEQASIAGLKAAIIPALRQSAPASSSPGDIRRTDIVWNEQALEPARLAAMKRTAHGRALLADGIQAASMAVIELE